MKHEMVLCDSGAQRLSVRPHCMTSLLMLAAIMSLPGCQADSVQAFVTCTSRLVAPPESRASLSRRAGHNVLRMQSYEDRNPRPKGTFGYPRLPADYPPKRPKNYTLKEGQIAVRFINTSGDPDVVVPAYPGERVTAVAKRGGVKIATACGTGLCGTCTTDLEDKNGKSYRPGFTTIRACVSRVGLIPGADEMVMDVYRSRSKKGNLNRYLSGTQENDLVDHDVGPETLPEAMSRFAEGWEDGGQDTPIETRGYYDKDREMITPFIELRDQNLMANEFVRSRTPREREGVDRWSDRAAEEELKRQARQVALQRRLRELKREDANDFLDHAARPFARIEDLEVLSPDERYSRSRFFEQPTRWEDVYGPVPSPPELERELDVWHNLEPDGISRARSAAYRAARQIPRYRAYGAPSLDEQDEEYFASKESEEPKEVTPQMAAALDRKDNMKRHDSFLTNGFVYRDSRTGREVIGSVAGTPTVYRAEPRSAYNQLPTCPSCSGSGQAVCIICEGGGYNVMGEGGVVCPSCNGDAMVTCTACHGAGVSRRA